MTLANTGLVFPFCVTVSLCSDVGFGIWWMSLSWLYLFVGGHGRWVYFMEPLHLCLRGHSVPQEYKRKELKTVEVTSDMGSDSVSNWYMSLRALCLLRQAFLWCSEEKTCNRRDHSPTNKVVAEMQCSLQGSHVFPCEVALELSCFFCVHRHTHYIALFSL